MVTAAGRRVPEALKRQLAPDGWLVIPVGSAGNAQRLLLIRRTDGRLREESLEWVHFVPLVASGAHGPGL